jgi:hypothetical protein
MSTVQSTTKTDTVKGEKAVLRAKVRTESADDIIQRRIEHGDQRGDVSQVPLKDQPEPMQTRWGNGSISGRLYELRQKGWTPVRWEELAQTENVTEFKRSPDGHVVKGEHGELVLYKLAVRLYKALTKAKSDRIRKQLGSEKFVKDRVREQSAIAGDRAVESAIAKTRVETFEATQSREAASEDE